MEKEYRLFHEKEVKLMIEEAVSTFSKVRSKIDKKSDLLDPLCSIINQISSGN